MKKLFSMLVMLFIVYFGIQVAFNIFGSGSESEYKIANEYEFTIFEKSTFKIPNSEDNYYFTVGVDNNEFKFQVFKNFSKKQRVIKDIKYFNSGNYKCILPIFMDNTILIDALCERNGVYEYANKINNKEINASLSKIEGYDKTKFRENSKNEEISNFVVNSNALFDNYYISLNSYRGLSTISKEFNKNLHESKIFEKDAYKQEIATYIDNYYLVANYNENYQFNKFYLIDLVKLDEKEITYHSKISFDSYIQGIVDGKVYLYDRDNGKQYEINISTKSVSEIGNASSGISYYDGEWTKISVTEADKTKLFVTTNNDLTDPTYVRIDKVGNEVGYYYLYRRNGNKYQVYRRNVQDDKLIYLFDTTTIDNIVYFNESVYYIDGNKIKTYSDYYGNLTVVTYNELSFNKNIKFNVYREQ